MTCVYTGHVLVAELGTYGRRGDGFCLKTNVLHPRVPGQRTTGAHLLGTDLRSDRERP